MGVAIVIVVAFIASSSSKAKAGVTTTSGFDLPAVSGSRRIRLADFKGKPTVVNFFASWCSACDAELPSFAAVSGGLRDRVNFVGVASLETGDPLYMPHRHHLDWPLARDVGGGNGSGLHDALCGCNSMPVTAFYDAEGRLVRVDRQALVGPALAGELQRLFNITT